MGDNLYSGNGIRLGYKAKHLTVDLTPRSDFISFMDTQDGAAWPEGMTLRLVFDDPQSTAWEATVSGPTAEWSVDKVEVDALIGRLTASKRNGVYLLYVEGDTDLVWARGTVDIGD